MIDWSLTANRTALELAGEGLGAGRCRAGSRRGALFTARTRAGRGGRRLELAVDGLRARSESFSLRRVAG